MKFPNTKTNMSLKEKTCNPKKNEARVIASAKALIKENMKDEQVQSLRNISKNQKFPIAEICLVGSVATGFFLIYGVIVLSVNHFWESREGFHSLAERFNLKMDIVGYVFLGIGISIPIIIGIAYFIARAIAIVDMANKYSQQQECLQGLCAHEELLRQSFRVRSDNGKIGNTDIQVLSLKYFDEKDSSAF